MKKTFLLLLLLFGVVSNSNASFTGKVLKTGLIASVLVGLNTLVYCWAEGYEHNQQTSGVEFQGFLVNPIYLGWKAMTQSVNGTIEDAGRFVLSGFQGFWEQNRGNLPDHTQDRIQGWALSTRGRVNGWLDNMFRRA